MRLPGGAFILRTSSKQQSRLRPIWDRQYLHRFESQVSSSASISPLESEHPLVSARKLLVSRRIPHLGEFRKQQRREFLGFGDGDEDRGMAKHHEEKRIMGYSPEQLFDVVAGVDMYQDFVPWCQKSKVTWRKGNQLEAELEIGFQFLVESYTSHVELKRPSLVKTTVSRSAIFEYLDNTWEIKAGPSPGSCYLHFVVDFQFRSPLYTKVANMFFEEVVARLVSAFENRCRMVYGPPKVTGHTIRA